MTDAEIIAAHRALAEYHRDKAERGILDILVDDHTEIAERLTEHADRLEREGSR